MKITITINTDNAAFEEHAGQEAARILERLARELKDWPGQNVFNLGLRDVNGNKVGEVEATR